MVVVPLVQPISGGLHQAVMAELERVRVAVVGGRPAHSRITIPGLGAHSHVCAVLEPDGRAPGWWRPLPVKRHDDHLSLAHGTTGSKLLVIWID